jgi:hypothetical protein
MPNNIAENSKLESMVKVQQLQIQELKFEIEQIKKEQDEGEREKRLDSIVRYVCAQIEKLELHFKMNYVRRFPFGRNYFDEASCVIDFEFVPSIPGHCAAWNKTNMEVFTATMESIFNMEKTPYQWKIIGEALMKIGGRHCATLLSMPSTEEIRAFFEERAPAALEICTMLNLIPQIVEVEISF